MQDDPIVDKESIKSDDQSPHHGSNLLALQAADRAFLISLHIRFLISPTSLFHRRMHDGEERREERDEGVAAA